MITRIQIVLVSVFILFASQVRASSPKLIVVICLDQFRYDYLTRFNDRCGEGGLRYLTNNGANFSNATYKHAFNTTGPGHAAIASGSYSDRNGIIANNWFDINSKHDQYCVGDGSVTLVSAAGEGLSPKNLVVSTFGDQLRAHSRFRSKVISLSNKDRAAILLGGKRPNGAFWMIDSAYVTSTYYTTRLPGWVRTFNESGIINSYFNRLWQRALPQHEYAMMDRDDAPYEGDANGLGKTFPHRIAGTDTTRITQSYYWALLSSPFSSEVLESLAKAAIRGERLGGRGTTDMLCVSFSATDFVGHTFGPDSQEILDMFVRTDRILADLLAFINRDVGLNNCVIVVTSDHGVTPIPERLLARDPHATAGRIDNRTLLEYSSRSLTRAFGSLQKAPAWIDRITGNNVYIDRDALSEKHVLMDSVSRILAESLKIIPQIAVVLTRNEILRAGAGSSIGQMMKRSFYPARSGDVVFVLKPHYIEASGTTGTSHSEPYDDDAHVPLVFVGHGFRKGTFVSEASPVDITPTLAKLLGIPFPAGREGRVLEEALTAR
jgi:predicted AlkP superfamily pyrophosphatase or phosphodiesterase